MGGPTSSVLLRQMMSDEQTKILDELLDNVSSTREGNDFSIADASFIGGDYQGGGLPFSVSFDDPNQLFESNEAELLQACFGFAPMQEIIIDSYCNGAEEYRILGLLTLVIAKTFSGIIDFNGALLPALPKETFQDMWRWEKANWSDVQSYFSQMTETMPGKILSVEYDVGNGRRWAHHVADTTWMEAWLQHPNFHMIK